MVVFCHFYVPASFLHQTSSDVVCCQFDFDLARPSLDQFAAAPTPSSPQRETYVPFSFICGQSVDCDEVKGEYRVLGERKEGWEQCVFRGGSTAECLEAKGKLLVGIEKWKMLTRGDN
jgi:hypothetical protein